MLARLAPTLVRRRRLVLVLAVIALAVAGAYGGGVVSSLTGGGFDDPAAPSSRAAAVIESTFQQGQPDLVLLARAGDGNVDSASAAAAGAALTARLAGEPGVVQAASYWSLGSPPPLKSTTGDTALIMVRLAGDDDAVADRAIQIADAVEGDQGALTITPGGPAVVNHAVSDRVESDLQRAEMIALPITLLLLVVVFGSVVAALLPLAVGILAIIGTFAVLQLMTTFTDVSIFSLNLTTALGLGLAIDYSLFVVSRFREELGHGYDTRTAVVRTVRTAGRTVIFSAVTVAISLAAMLVFPITFLKSFAYAGIAVALMAAIGAVVVLPALLAALGHRVNKGAIFHRSTPAVGQGTWHRIATVVMRRPLPIATAAIVFLLALGSPFLHIAFGLPDDRVLPPGDSARAVQDALRDDFTSREASPLEIVMTGIDPSRDGAQVAGYATALSQVPGVARVDAATGSYAGGGQVAPAGPAAARFVAPEATWLSVVPSVEPMSAEGEAVVHAVRAVPSPAPALVGGPSAELVDSKDSLFSSIPLAAGIIVVTTFVVLFLLFGSLLVPLKAVVLNILSLTATFGAMVWIFQDGHLSGLLDFTPTGTIAVVMPILMFCIAFGLSMDYEVFLLSRIKEEHDDGADTATSVARGLERSGRIVTAAAILIAVVFIAFATSGVAFIKLFGIGLTLAVLVDAFVIRATLVPAFMTLAGDANWWAPRWLRRIHDRIGISEHVELDDDVVPPAGDEPLVRGRIADVTSTDTRQRARRGEGDRLRGEILAAAEDLLVETADESAVSIRAIAERVGITAPSIYRHFADKDTLILSVVESVFGRLDAALEEAAADATDPIDEILRKGHAYVEFGLAHPEHYRLLFMCKDDRKKDHDLDGPAVAGAAAFDHLQDTVQRVLALATPGVERPDPFAMTCAIWSGVHGITSLRIAMPGFPWPPVDEQLALLAGPWREALCPTRAAARRSRARVEGAAAVRRRADGSQH